MKIAASSVVALLMASLSGCLNGPGFMKQSNGTLTNNSKEREAEVLSDEGGIVTAKLGASQTDTQVVSASSESAIAGSQISFPPGSVSIDTAVTVEEGASLANDALAASLGVAAGTFSSAGPTTVIQSETPTDAVTAFTVALVVPSSLRLQAGQLAVAYRVFIAAEGHYVEGVIPPSELTLSAGKVAFQTKYFGAYQPIRSTVEIAERKEVKTDQAIVTAVAAAEAFDITDLTPYAAGSGQVVTIKGKNFRNTMTLALGSARVDSLKVESDVKASFVMPDSVSYGFNDMVVEQDGVQQKQRLFARVDKTDFPLITMEESGVCKGVTYYDAAGNKKTGTKACAAGGAGDMTKAVYDVNADGVVEKAVTANSALSAASAQSAQVADWGRGKAGSPANVPSSPGIMSLAGDGSYYVAAGTGTVTGLSSAPEGTRVTIRFSDLTIVRNNFVTPRLILSNPNDVVVRNGDAMEFISNGGGDWREVGRSILSSYVSGTMTNSLSGLGLNSVTDLVFDSESVDTLGEYNSTSGVFTPVENGSYEFSVNITVFSSEYPSYMSSSRTANLQVRDGTANSIAMFSPPVSNISGVRAFATPLVHSLIAGHAYTVQLEHKASVNTASTSVNSTLKIRKMAP